jgi:hypothetical protein
VRDADLVDFYERRVAQLRSQVTYHERLAEDARKAVEDAEVRLVQAKAALRKDEEDRT